MARAATSPPKPRMIDRLVGPSPRERYLDDQLEAVHGTLANLQFWQESQIWDTEMGEGGFGARFKTIAEGLSRVDEAALGNLDMMLDAQGWSPAYEHDSTGGITLAQVQLASQQIRELMVGNPFIQNGARIRTAAVHGGGIEFSARTKFAQTKTTGSGANRSTERVAAGSPVDMPERLRRIMDLPRNKRYVFCNTARSALEAGAFSDGTVFLLGRDSDLETRRVPIGQITGDLRNPDDPGEIIAYRRTWNRNPNAEGDAKQEITRWYYTDLTPPEKRKGSITYQGKSEKFERGYTLLDLSFNKQIGWAYGTADAMAVIAWSRLYKEFLVNGYIMSRALARFAFKVTSKSGNATARASEEVVKPGQAGSTSIFGDGTDLNALGSAGKGYDFGSGSPIAAAMAAGLGISLLSLTANPASATGSNAAAQTLGPVEKMTAAMRRGEWDDHYGRLFAYYGLASELVTTWGDISDELIQRIMQAWTLADQLEVFGPEVIQREVSDALGIADPGDVPAGWKPKSKRGIKPADSAAGNGGATDGSGQGADDGTGGSDQDKGDTDEQ